MTFQERYKYNPQTDLLGKGGFARVYKALDTLLDREVAIKIFNVNDQNHYTVVEEIKRVIKFKHPNLLSYYDVALIKHTTPLSEKETIQIGVMELANAGDLKQFAKNNPNSPILFQLLKQVLSGLEYLHQKGIIHRDLKPQNILLVEEDGEVTAKISDFGISKNTDAATNSSSMAIGTIEYMAPEQFNPAKYGINNKIGTNVDLWSFGIMVHELLTDKPLFGQRNGNTTAEQIMSAILSSDIPEGIDDLPEPYRSTVKKCLIKDAKERAQKANELLTLLEAKKPVTATTYSSNETIILPKQAIQVNDATQVLPKKNSESQNQEKKPLEVGIKKRIRNKLVYVTSGIIVLIAVVGFWMNGSIRSTFNSEKPIVVQPQKIKITNPVIQTTIDNMIAIEGGTFKMGSTNQEDDGAQPVHSVTVSSFKIGKYEVTVKEFAAFIQATNFKTDAQKLGSSFTLNGEQKGVTWRDDEKGKPRPENDWNNPVIHVSRNDATAYCKWLSQQTGKDYRLPTEAEWEFAAKGGMKSKKYTFSGGNSITDVAWIMINSNSQTHPVGQKRPNELGLYDMSGNVWEWCSDWYDENYYANSPSSNPKGPPSGSYRVYRGGAFDYNVFFGVASRSGCTPECCGGDIGFRLVSL